MIQPIYNLIFGDEWMALYKDGELVVEGVTLTFGDILEACRIPCAMQSADIEWAAAQHKVGHFPHLLKDVPIDREEEKV